MGVGKIMHPAKADAQADALPQAMGREVTLARFYLQTDGETTARSEWVGKTLATEDLLAPRAWA